MNNMAVQGDEKLIYVMIIATVPNHNYLSRLSENH